MSLRVSVMMTIQVLFHVYQLDDKSIAMDWVKKKSTSLRETKSLNLDDRSPYRNNPCQTCASHTCFNRPLRHDTGRDNWSGRSIYIISRVNLGIQPSLVLWKKAMASYCPSQQVQRENWVLICFNLLLENSFGFSLGSGYLLVHIIDPIMIIALPFLVWIVRPDS